MAAALRVKAFTSATAGPRPAARPARLSLRPAKVQTRKVAMSAASEYDRQKANAERWEAMTRSGRVGNISGSEAGKMMKEGWVLLDVRPRPEVEKASVIGAVEVPLFVPDTTSDFSSFVKNSTMMAMGGWWLGGSHMLPNPDFMTEVQSKVPKDAKVIVACQKGLRSLAACEQLVRAGYPTVSWINGGLDTCSKEDLPSKDNIDLRYGGIGGLSEVLGWTDVQRSESKSQGFGGGVFGLLRIVAGLIVLDALVFGYEYVQYLQNGSQ